MNRERIEPEELFSEMHKNGIEELSMMKWAILEPGGDLSFIRTDDEPTDKPDKKRVF